MIITLYICRYICMYMYADVCMYLYIIYINTYIYVYIYQYIDWRAMHSSDLQYSTLRTLQRNLRPVSLEVLKSEDGATWRACRQAALFFLSSLNQITMPYSYGSHALAIQLLQLCSSLVAAVAAVVAVAAVEWVGEVRWCARRRR